MAVSADKSEYEAYISFLKPDRSQPAEGFIFAASWEAIARWQEKKDNKDDPKGASRKTRSANTPDRSDVEKTSTPTDLTISELSNLLMRFYRSISGYRLLTATSFNAIPLMETAHLEFAVYRDALKYLDVVQDEGDFITFGVHPISISMMQNHLEYLDRAREATESLPGAILLSLVATFDSLIVELISILLRSRPENFKKSEKSISVSDILSMSSFDDVIEKLISDETSNVMRGSHAAQIEYMEKRFNFSLKTNHPRWGRFIEVFERRNLVAHGDSFVNDIYLSNCSNNDYDVSGVSKDQKLIIDRKYLLEGADTLIEFGIELLFQAWSKNFPKHLTPLHDQSNYICYTTIKQGRLLLATNLLEFFLSNGRNKMSDHSRKMMIINLANCHKLSGNIDDVDKTLDNVDWSATSDEFNICIASIKEDVDKVVSLMPKVCEGSTIYKDAFREWPVFKWIRNNEKFREKFFEIYNEDFSREPRTVEGAEDPKSVS